MKEDRRTKYTKMVLKNSLIQLLQSKQMTEITVKELCLLADINRSTFYSHYANHYELKTQIENELMIDLTHYLSMYSFEKDKDGLKMTEKLLEYIANKKIECEVLLNENAASNFQQEVEQLAHQFMIKNELIEDELNEYVRSFIISGSVQMIRLWMSKGLKESPKEMAYLINSLIQKMIVHD